MTRNVARNAAWNVAGTLSSFVVGLIALPVLLHALGAARLGVFTLALGLIGFSGLLDLGLGRALTQTVSSALGRGRPSAAVAALVWYVLRLLAGFGLVWVLVLWLLVSPVVLHLFHLRGELASETIFGLRAVALSMPFALVATGAMGSLEGLQEFRRVSTKRAALSVLQYGLPTLVALWRPDVGWVITGLAVSRAFGVVVWLHALHIVLPKPRDSRSDPDDVRHLLRFGGWLSVSNLVGPLMAYADRFYLASLFPPAMVASYTVPYDALSRVMSLPMTAIGAVFPALAEARASPDSSVSLLRGAIMAMVALMLPPLLLVMIFASPLLTLWLGQVFALSTLPVFQMLLLGVFVNSGAHVPYALLQAHDRSDLTAKLHLAELPIFAGLLVWAVAEWGIIGAALAWTLRIVLDTAMLYGLAILLQPAQRRVLAKGAALVTLAGAALVIPLLTHDWLILGLVALLVLASCSIMLKQLYSRWHSDSFLTSSI
jgi:O-antigen/teichoic acid export membrane protein